MIILTNLLALLGIVCVCLVGVAGVGYFSARQNGSASPIQETTTHRVDERKTES